MHQARVAFLVLAVVSTGACLPVLAGRSPVESVASTVPASSPASLAAADRALHPLDGVAAVVNARVITLSEVEARVARIVAARPATESAPGARDALVNATYAAVLEEMIENDLLIDAALASALTVTPDEVEDAVGKIALRTGDEAAFDAALAAEGLTRESHRAAVRDELLRMKYVALRVRSLIRVDDETLHAYYAKLRSLGPLKPFDAVRDTVLERYVTEETERLRARLIAELKAAAYVDVRVAALRPGGK